MQDYRRRGRVKRQNIWKCSGICLDFFHLVGARSGNVLFCKEDLERNGKNQFRIFISAESRKRTGCLKRGCEAAARFLLSFEAETCSIDNSIIQKVISGYTRLATRSCSSLRFMLAYFVYSHFLCFIKAFTFFYLGYISVNNIHELSHVINHYILVFLVISIQYTE